MAKKTDYDLNLLTIYLMSRSKNEVKMSIDEIERIACGKLPDFMHTYSGSNVFGIMIITGIRLMLIIGLTQVILLIRILKIPLFTLPNRTINPLREKKI